MVIWDGCQYVKKIATQLTCAERRSIKDMEKNALKNGYETSITSGNSREHVIIG